MFSTEQCSSPSNSKRKFHRLEIDPVKACKQRITSNPWNSCLCILCVISPAFPAQLSSPQTSACCAGCLGGTWHYDVKTWKISRGISRFQVVAIDVCKGFWSFLISGNDLPWPHDSWFSGSHIVLMCQWFWFNWPYSTGQCCGFVRDARLTNVNSPSSCFRWYLYLIVSMYSLIGCHMVSWLWFFVVLSFYVCQVGSLKQAGRQWTCERICWGTRDIWHGKWWKCKSHVSIVIL
jgi:hypothetical protein